MFFNFLIFWFIICPLVSLFIIFYSMYLESEKIKIDLEDTVSIILSIIFGPIVTVPVVFDAIKIYYKKHKSDILIELDFNKKDKE